MLANNYIDLEDYLLNFEDHIFPKNIDYKARYNVIKAVAKAAQDKIHQGNIEVENKGDNGRSLTGHDPKHFQKVIKMASELVMKSNCDLSSYEIFMLLCAIQIHDIGNIVGRENHNQTAIDVFHDLMPPNAVLDTIETNIFHSIAEVHTTAEAEDKDTITKLGTYEISHNDEIIKHQLLAAILKLADELADDPERAFMYGVKMNLIKEGSKLHHIYCNSLTSTIIDGKRIAVFYKFDLETAMTEFDYNGSTIFLLDYIFERNIKMHCERMYCQKFMRPEIIKDYIDVEITIYSKGFKKKVYEIKYRLLEKGYPDSSSMTIKSICEDPEKQLKDNNGLWWSGIVLKNNLSNHAEV